MGRLGCYQEREDSIYDLTEIYGRIEQHEKEVFLKGLDDLIKNMTIDCRIQKTKAKTSLNNFWNISAFYGYLSIDSIRDVQNFSLQIPNTDIRNLFTEKIQELY